MKGGKRWLIIGAVVIVVVAFMTTYTVKFTENAIVTTFGRAATAPIDSPGLKVTIPYIQQVTKYDRRARYLESKPETQGTRDKRQIVVTAYVTWRISDPNRFYQRFSASGSRATNHYKGAESLLSDKLRNALGEVSNYNFDELLNAGNGGSHIKECEDGIKERLSEQGADKDGKKQTLASEFGLEPLTVGIISVELPESNTSVVFERMMTERTRLASEQSNQGMAQAATIRNQANTAAQKIKSFAEARAKLIRAQGEEESQQFVKELAKEPKLAIFLRNMELMREAFGNNRATLVIPAGPVGGWPGFEYFRPDAGKDFKTGLLHGFDADQVPTAGKTPAAPSGAAGSDPKAASKEKGQ